MNRNLVCVCVLIASLAVMGCQPNGREQTAVVEQAPVQPRSTTVTLSADQLMALDWGGRALGHADVTAKRPIGEGVEFDVRFPGNSKEACSLDYTSSGSGGRKALVGLRVDSYEAFALKFTLISANGRKDPNVPLEVAVGAIISPAGDGRFSACEPVVLGLSAEQSSAVATTPMRTQIIRGIGIHVNMVNPLAWDSDGGIVTLRVEPAPDADILAGAVPAVGQESGSQSVQSVRTDPNDPPAKTPKSGSRTKPASQPTFGASHIGAW